MPEETSPLDRLIKFNRAQTKQGFDTVIKYVDPIGVLKRYANWDDDKLIVFKDRDQKSVVDFLLEFKKEGAPLDRTHLKHLLRFLKLYKTENLPLFGVRVALDPGHMGGEDWDRRTGKFFAYNGKKVSEGEIALITSLLLKKKLETLGAEVLITRDDLKPVSALNFETFDYSEFAIREFYQSTDLSWFETILNASTTPENLATSLNLSEHVKGLWRPEMRKPYFITRADIIARAEMINAFQPHLTLVIHYDAWNSPSLKINTSRVRGYIPGNILATELASREQRYAAVRTLFEGHRWIESLMFTNNVVKAVGASAHLRLLDSPNDLGAIKVRDGVYARNLALNRLVESGAICYIECLMYDDRKEFTRISAHDRTLKDDSGKVWEYSSRIEEVADGIKQGVLNYVESIQNESESTASTTTP